MFPELDSIWRTERWNRVSGLHLSRQCYSAFVMDARLRVTRHTPNSNEVSFFLFPVTARAREMEKEKK